MTGLIARSVVVERFVQSSQSPSAQSMAVDSPERAHPSPPIHTLASSTYSRVAKASTRSPASSIYSRVARSVTLSPVSSIYSRVARSLTPSPPMLPSAVYSPVARSLMPARPWYARPDWASLVRDANTSQRAPESPTGSSVQPAKQKRARPLFNYSAACVVFSLQRFRGAPGGHVLASAAGAVAASPMACSGCRWGLQCSNPSGEGSPVHAAQRMYPATGGGD